MNNVDAITSKLQVNPDTCTISDFAFKQTLWAYLEAGLLTKKEFMTIMDITLDRAIYYGLIFNS